MSTNRRVFYAIYSAALSKLGEQSYTAIHGLQSLGVSTRFNLEQVFEVGQISLYANIENIPDVEVTTQKVLDGYPLVYHLATKGSTSPTLAGRSNVRCSMGVAIYGDTQDSASGTPVAQVEMSGLYVSAIAYTFPTNGNAVEDLTLVGNNKTWLTSWTAPTFNNLDAPAAASGVTRRQHVMMGSGNSYFPTDIPGIDASGWNQWDGATGSYKAHIQQVRASTNLGREALYELGRKGAYYRYAQFPAQVQVDIDVTSGAGDSVEALEDADNIVDQKIVILTTEGTKVDLGTKNKQSSVTMTGGNAGQQGGNQTLTYSYINFNDFIVTDPADPSGL